MDSKTLNSHPISSTSASKLLFASPAPSCQPPLPPRFDHLYHLRSMSCSVPNTVGTSDWLSYLRRSRGFPDTDNIGLEDFLRSIKEKDSKTCIESVLLKTPQPDKDEDGEDMQGRDNKANGNSCTVKKANQDFKVADPVEEEEKRHLDFSGCSQPEVTVIDTSPSSWKSEKMLNRKKNVRKVGDKKGKGSKTRDRKKSKKSYKKQQCVKTCAVSKNSDKVSSPLPLTVTWNRKRKRTAKKGCEKQKNLNLCNSVAYVDKGKAMVRPKCAQVHDQGKEMVAASEKQQDNCSQVHEKRVLKKQIDGGSSVILIKSIPLTTSNKKDMSGLSRSCVKLQK